MQRLLLLSMSGLVNVATLTVGIVVAVTSAGVPPKCVSPTVWEGRYVENDPAKGLTELGEISYDAANERIAKRVKIMEGETVELYHTILLYGQGIGYKINARNNHCEKFPLKEVFPYIEVPANVTFLGESYIGTSSAGDAAVLVNTWAGETIKGHYRGIWTTEDCLPVADSYTSATGGYFYVEYYDVALSIPNPFVFVPPEKCQN